MTNLQTPATALEAAQIAVEGTNRITMRINEDGTFTARFNDKRQAAGVDKLLSRCQRGVGSHVPAVVALEFPSTNRLEITFKIVSRIHTGATGNYRTADKTIEEPAVYPANE